MEENKETQEPKTAFQKADDWWAKHNIGTRFALVTMIALYVSLVWAYLCNPALANIVQVLEIVGWISFSSFITVTLGDNGLSKIAEIIKAIKMKN